MADNNLPPVAEKFLRYVRIDTQSDRSSDTTPSTAKQKDLGRLLVRELRAMGIADAAIDDHGYVYGSLAPTADGGPARLRFVRSDGGYVSARDPRVLVGLGSGADTLTVSVTWPAGRTTRIEGLRPGAYTHLTGPASRP